MNLSKGLKIIPKGWHLGLGAANISRFLRTIDLGLIFYVGFKKIEGGLDCNRVVYDKIEIDTVDTHFSKRP